MSLQGPAMGLYVLIMWVRYRGKEQKFEGLGRHIICLFGECLYICVVVLLQKNCLTN